MISAILNDIERFPIQYSRTYPLSGWVKWVATADELVLFRVAQPSIQVEEAEMISFPYKSHNVAEIIKTILARFGTADILKWPICALHPDRPVLSQNPDDDSCTHCLYQKITRHETCAICLDETRTHALWVENAACQHCFHAKCIAKLVHQNRNHPTVPCPLCRAPYCPVLM